MPMTPRAAEAAVLARLAAQQDAMLRLLQETVNIDSGSYDKAGVDAVGECFKRFFRQQGLTTTSEPHATYGEAIHVRCEGAEGGRPIVLLGHRDTVFPPGEARRRPFRIDDGRAYGPGVADMKGGLVMNAFVLAAFKRFGGAPAPLAGLITADEEIASPSSRPIIERVGRGARCVFNAEPGRASGNIVTGRKGGVFLAFEIFGRAAHSGGNFEHGISAIVELAHKILAMQALTGSEAGITVNVGLVKGGQSVNTVAPTAAGEIDLRYREERQRAGALAALQAIVDSATIPGTTARLELRGEFLPMTSTPRSRELFDCYRSAAAAAGLDLDGEFTGGCADSGFTAAVGCPTLCGLGPVGGHAHTPQEYLDVASLVPRAQALALSILRLPQSAH
jgi:glutamate carboxypeptidase